MENIYFSDFTIKINEGSYKVRHQGKYFQRVIQLAPRRKIFGARTKRKWACEWLPAAHTSPHICSLVKSLSKINHRRKYKRFCKIQEAMHKSTLKVNLGYIVYNSTQDQNNPLPSHQNTKTKEYLWESVTAFIFQDNISKLYVRHLWRKSFD